MEDEHAGQINYCLTQGGEGRRPEENRQKIDSQEEIHVFRDRQMSRRLSDQLRRGREEERGPSLTLEARPERLGPTHRGYRLGSTPLVPASLGTTVWRHVHMMKCAIMVKTCSTFYMRF